MWLKSCYEDNSMLLALFITKPHCCLLFSLLPAGIFRPSFLQHCSPCPVCTVAWDYFVLLARSSSCLEPRGPCPALTSACQGPSGEHPCAPAHGLLPTTLCHAQTHRSCPPCHCLSCQRCWIFWLRCPHLLAGFCTLNTALGAWWDSNFSSCPNIHLVRAKLPFPLQGC